MGGIRNLKFNSNSNINNNKIQGKDKNNLRNFKIINKILSKWDNMYKINTNKLRNKNFNNNHNNKEDNCHKILMQIIINSFNNNNSNKRNRK